MFVLSNPYFVVAFCIKTAVVFYILWLLSTVLNFNRSVAEIGVFLKITCTGTFLRTINTCTSLVHTWTSYIIDFVGSRCK